MSYLTNPYRYVSAVASVIFSEDQDGSSGYTVYHTETSALPVSGDTYYLGTNNNGYGGALSSASPAWSTVGDSSSGTWTISGNSVSKTETTWNDDYILGKNALGSANQTVTDIMISTMDSQWWVGFVRIEDVEIAKTDEVCPRFGLNIDGGGTVRSIINGVTGSGGIFPNWTTASKFKIEILVDV
jgi:hypothetical protein